RKLSFCKYYYAKMSNSRRSRYSRSRSPCRRDSRSTSRSLSELRSRSRSRDSFDVDNPGNSLYVTGLSSRVTKKEIEKHFSIEGGKVVDVHLVVDPRTRDSRGFGFVTMSHVDDADQCLKYLDRSVLGGRVISVERAKRRRGRTPTPGRYMGLIATRGAATVPRAILRGTATAKDPGLRITGVGKDRTPLTTDVAVAGLARGLTHHIVGHQSVGARTMADMIHPIREGPDILFQVAREGTPVQSLVVFHLRGGEAQRGVIPAVYPPSLEAQGGVTLPVLPLDRGGALGGAHHTVCRLGRVIPGVLV
ncbi:hypothetical protein GIB67_027334, partial [Kingdonia uniflora]